MIRSLSYEQSAAFLAQREKEERERREKELKEKEEQERLFLHLQERENGVKSEKSSDIPRFTGDARPGSHRALSESSDKSPSRQDSSDSIARVKSYSRSSSRSDNSTRLSRSSSNPVTDALTQVLDELHTGLTPRAENPMTKAQIQERAKEMLAQGFSPQEVEAFILEQGEIRKRALEAIRREKEANDSPSSSPPALDKVEKKSRSKPSIKVMSKEEIKEKARAMLASGVPNEEVLAFIKEQQDIREKHKAAKKENR